MGLASRASIKLVVEAGLDFKKQQVRQYIVHDLCFKMTPIQSLVSWYSVISELLTTSKKKPSCSEQARSRKGG